MNPILICRNITNKINQNNHYNLYTQLSKTNNILKTNIKENKFYLIKGLDLLIIKRSTDWITRFIFIHKFEELYKNIFNKESLGKYDKLITTFIGSALTMPISTPIDRFIPLVYDKNYKEIYNTIKSRNIKNLYVGGIARFFNIGLYTSFIMYINL